MASDKQTLGSNLIAGAGSIVHAWVDQMGGSPCPHTPYQYHVKSDDDAARHDADAMRRDFGHAMGTFERTSLPPGTVKGLWTWK